MVGPGRKLNSRYSRAASGLTSRYDQENTPRRSVPASPPSSRSNSLVLERSCVLARSSVAKVASGRRGFVATRAAASARANGSPSQRAMMSAAIAGSAAVRSAPIRLSIKVRASVGVSRPTSSGTAPAVATSGVSWLRLVTSARQPGAPGSSGWTCSTSRTLSNSTNTRLPASRLR
jgi:hypothetical protein